MQKSKSSKVISSPFTHIFNWLPSISTQSCSVLCVLNRVHLFVTPWTVAYQAPLSMGFSRQQYWSGLPFPSPGDLPNPGIEPGSPALQTDALLSEPPGKHMPILSLLIPGKLKHFPKFPPCLCLLHMQSFTLMPQKYLLKKSYQFTLLLKTNDFLLNLHVTVQVPVCHLRLLTSRPQYSLPD